MYRHLSGQLSPRCEGLACRLYRAHYSRAASIPGINVPQPSSRASSTGQEVHRHIYVVHVRSRTDDSSSQRLSRNLKVEFMESANMLGARPSTRSHPHPLATAPVLYRCSAYGTRNIAMSTLNSVRGPTPADANPSTRGLIWIRAHTA